jgi:hypothetical protein
MAVFWVVTPCRLVWVTDFQRSILSSSSTPLMEAVRTSETSVNSHQSTRRYNPQGSHLHTHRRENSKSYAVFAVSTRHFTDTAMTGKSSVTSRSRRTRQLILQEAPDWKTAVRFHERAQTAEKFSNINNRAWKVQSTQAHTQEPFANRELRMLQV